MWKFEIFPATLMRENNCGKFWVSNTTILTILKALNFDVLESSALMNCKKSPKLEIRVSKNLSKWPNFKIDFTENMNIGKIANFPHCAPLIYFLFFLYLVKSNFFSQNQVYFPQAFYNILFFIFQQTPQPRKQAPPRWRIRNLNRGIYRLSYLTSTTPKNYTTTWLKQK